MKLSFRNLFKSRFAAAVSDAPPADSADRRGIQAGFERAIEHYEQGEWSDAQRLCQLALEGDAEHFSALNLLGTIAAQTQCTGDAAELLRRALAIHPDDASVLNNLGNVLRDLCRFDEALACYDRAIALRRDFADLHFNRGITLANLRRMGEAISSFDAAIELRPEEAGAYNNRALALMELRQLEDALASLDLAIQFQPGSAETHINRGNALQELNRPGEALISYDRAIELQPDLPLAHANRASTLHHLQQYEESLISLSHALALKPDYEYLSGLHLRSKMGLFDWDDFDGIKAGLLKRVESGGKATDPFSALAITDSLQIQRAAAEIWATAASRRTVACMPARRSSGGKIRIGYYSADFYNHATASLMAGFFECHNRGQFELVAFSFGPSLDDEYRRRIVAAFDRFIDVRQLSDSEIAMRSRDMEIDIAVDLKGFTTAARPGIFASRAAPVQAQYLGYPGTMGADFIDYLIADETLIPPGSRRHYSEKIAYLPNSYQVNDGSRRIGAGRYTREALGLPGTGFVFCCFNNSYKITPATFSGWMRILNQVEGSVLWLLHDNPTAIRNLGNEALRRGIDSNRLVFAGRMPHAEHLARHRAADLFIDTLPYNAHTTASDALWAGLPVLTLSGESFAGRVAASLLGAIDLPELVTTTQEEFEATAVDLATHSTRLETIRGKLACNRLSSPLFDTAQFAANIEDAYRQMHQRHLAGLPADHLFVNLDPSFGAN